MSLSDWKEKCKKCSNKFEVTLVGNVYPGCKDLEDIICPYCGYVNGTTMTSQIVKTNKI